MIISWFERHNKISWFVTLFIAIIIFYLSSLSFEGSGGNSSYLSIVYHFFAFFFLGFFMLVSLLKGKQNNVLFFIGLFVVILYGISDEVHQIFVPGRFAGIFDILWDTIGTTIAGIIYYLRIRK